MAHAELEDDGITILTEYRDSDLIRAMPGAHYDTKRHRWRAPLSWGSCRTLRGLFGERLSIGESLNTWAGVELQNRVRPALALRASLDAPGDPALYPFQRAGVEFMHYAKRALICDEMGTGKTVQAIRTLAYAVARGENPFPAIIVSPNNMKRTWKREFEKWFPGTIVTVVSGGIVTRRKQIATPSHVYITNWEGARSHTRLSGYGDIRLRRCWRCDPTLSKDDKLGKAELCERCPKEFNKIPWKTVIVDEAHRMKNPRAKQTRACWALVTKDSEYIFAMTGTAIANNPIDLWPALRLISKNEWPSRTQYIDRYCATSFNPWSQGITVTGLRPETSAEFFDIVDPRMRRMPKEAVLPWLPKKTYSTRYVEMAPKQAKAYKQMENGLVAMLDDGVTVAISPLVQVTRLVQFASAYAELVDGEVRLTDPSCKLDALEEILEEMGNEPAVVFAQSRQLIDMAAKRMEKLKIPYGLIVGGQNDGERDMHMQRFQTGYDRVILCTIAAGGVGITLTRAGTAIFLQRSWSMVDDKQAEDRVHRIGSEIHDKIQIIDVLAINTLEERQREVLGEKAERLEEVMRDRQLLRRILTGV